MSNRQNQIPRRGHAKGMSRRKFVGTAAGATAAGGIAIGFPNIALGATSIRTIGLGVSIMNELQGRATKDLGAKIRGQALGYGALFGKMLNQNDQYEVCEHNFAELELFVPSKVWQPIDTHRVKNWDKVTDLCKTGRLTPGSQLGQGDAPYRHLWLDKDGNFTKGPSRYISMVPVWHNADSIGYNPEITKRKIDSWADLLSPEFKGQGALINVPQIGTMDAALAVEAMGLITFKDKGNMSRQEIDFLIDVLIKKKKQGHFRAFWENFGQSVNLMVSGEVAVQSMWSPAVSAVQAGAYPASMPSPRRACAAGMAGWRSRPRRRARSWMRPMTTSTGGSTAGPGRSSRARAITCPRPRPRARTSIRRSGITGTTASPPPRTCRTRSATPSSPRAMSGMAAPIGRGSRKSRCGTR